MALSFQRRDFNYDQFLFISKVGELHLVIFEEDRATLFIYSHGLQKLCFVCNNVTW